MFDFSRITGPEDSKQENFSTLSTCLIMRLFPAAKPVDGRGGDEGLDTYLGEFNGVVHAYQHKYFLATFTATQRRQIKSSLKQALRFHDIEEWTLIIPKDLTPAEQRWFATLHTEFPGVALDWWGKTKLLELLAAHQDLAAAFQPAQPLTIVILGKDHKASDITTDLLSEKLTDMGYSLSAQLASAVYDKLATVTAPARLRILVLGPGKGSGLCSKRVEIRDRLRALGHHAQFSEDLLRPQLLAAGGLNFTIEEYLQAYSLDYIICLLASPDEIVEIHDFAKKRHLACRMMICVSEHYKHGHSVADALQVFQGLNGRLDWYKDPEDLTECHVATRAIRQVEHTAAAKAWELSQRGTSS